MEEQEILKKGADGDAEEENEQEEDEEVGEEQSWEVREIVGVRMKKDHMEFNVVWDLDGSKSWEPQTNFPGQLEHERIVDFAKRNPKQYANVLDRLERGSKKWAYVKIDEDAYEKPDESAAKEAQRLADPNRLADETEQLIKTFDDGGRVSRSKTHAILRNIHTAESSPSPKRTTTSNQQMEKKKERKRKHKKNAEPSQLEQDSSNKESKIVIEENGTPTTSKKKKQTPPERIENKIEATEDLEEYHGKNWKRKERNNALNSSDSEGMDDDTQKASQSSSGPASSAPLSDRIEGGANTRSLTQTAESSSTSKAPAKKKKKTVVDDSKKEHIYRKIECKEPIKHDYVERDKVEKERSTVRDAQIIHTGERREDLGIEKAFEEFGITIMKDFSKNRSLVKYNARKSAAMKKYKSSLDLAIRSADEEATEIFLLDMNPQQAFIEICNKTSLHELLSNAFQQKRRGVADESMIQNRAGKIEKIVRLALSILPHEVLILQDNNLNTLLHGAINIENVSLVEFLLRMGSPLHIRNKYEMTAVESCIVIKNAVLLEMVLRYGGSFHHILSRDVAADKADHTKLFSFIRNSDGPEMHKLISVAENHRRKIQEACDRTRKKLIATRLKEQEFGPLISFPRGNLKYSCYQQTIQFVVPENWIKRKNAKFTLAVIPIVFDNKRKLFIASSKKVPLKSEPYLAGRRCKSMTNRKGMFYRATTALRHHFQKTQNGSNQNFPSLEEFEKLDTMETLYEREEHVMRRNLHTVHPRLCPLSISFDQMAPFAFVVCQLILYEPDKTATRLTTSHIRPYLTSNSKSAGPSRQQSRQPAYFQQRPAGHSNRL